MTTDDPAEGRILVVEDDPDMQALIRMTLGSGFEITEAKNADEAIRALDWARPELVLLDWRLPGTWGSEVLDVFKHRSPAVPVIVLTAQDDTPTRLLAEELGANLFITKPFRPTELVAAIRSLLREARG